MQEKTFIKSLCVKDSIGDIIYKKCFKIINCRNIRDEYFGEKVDPYASELYLLTEEEVKSS